MVERFFNFIIYKIYNRCKKYLLKHNQPVSKEDFDYLFWGDGL